MQRCVVMLSYIVPTKAVTSVSVIFSFQNQHHREFCTSEYLQNAHIHKVCCNVFVLEYDILSGFIRGLSLRYDTKPPEDQRIAGHWKCSRTGELKEFSVAAQFSNCDWTQIVLFSPEGHMEPTDTQGSSRFHESLKWMNESETCWRDVIVTGCEF